VPLQLQVRFSPLQHRNVRVRILPQREEILIGRFSLRGVTLQHKSAAEAKRKVRVKFDRMFEKRNGSIRPLRADSLNA
jgi:hypothetical protein